jgi:hypothetical protein
VQGVQDIGGETVVKKKPENVVAVMPGSLKPYFYFVLRRGTLADPLQQTVKALQAVWNGENVREDFPIRVDDEAVVLVLGNVNPNRNHSKNLQR